MNLTPEQEQAIHNHDRNLVVVAGAGSGKTYVLVERYLALLDAHPDWELNQLVAITFTQKAAQEMRDRVRQGLAARLNTVQDAGDAVLMALWSRRLATMDSARIDTVHGLCAVILRQNAADAGIDPKFEVLDENEARFLLEGEIDRLLSALARENDPIAALFREYGEGEIRRSLMEWISQPANMPPDDLFQRWQAEWQTAAGAHIRALLDTPDFSAAASWSPSGGFPNGDDKLLDVWRRSQMHLDSLRHSDDLAVQIAALRALMGAINLQAGSAKAWGGADILKEAKDALRSVRELSGRTLEEIGEPPNTHDQRAAELIPLWAALLGYARSAYGDAKSERGVLDFDDLEALTNALLEQPHVRSRYRNREFKHVLVDEFQDTNAAQWSIVQALADPGVPGSLFLVGDPKQSIYAFRGADVRVFDHARAIIRQAGGDIIPLARSFRTHASLVTCFNDLFGHLLTRDPHSPAAAYQVELGEPMDAARAETPDDDPVMELLLIDKTDLSGGDDDASGLARRLEAEAIAQHIRQLVERNACVYDRREGVRPIRYDDCALLFRSMSHAPLYEDVFKRMGLPFVTVAGRGYYDRQEVWDVLNLLRALHNPADDLALAAALRSPFFVLSDDALFGLRLRPGVTGRPPALATALHDLTGIPDDDRDRVSFAAEMIESLRKLAGRVTIAELIEEALDVTGYLAVLTGLPDGARRRGNIEKLLEKARTSGKLTLGEFSRYLIELSEIEAREGEAALEADGAVVLMTVHKSKGLEYPVVYLVDASHTGGGHSGTLLNDGGSLACQVYAVDEARMIPPYAYRRARRLREAREEAEARRLLYVAATRAQDRLIVSGQVKRRKNGSWSATGWLQQLLALYTLGDLQDNGVLDFSWGQMRVTLVRPGDTENTSGKARADDTPLDWPVPLVTPIRPPLLAALRPETDAPARALTATQIAHLGTFAAFDADLPQRSLYRQRLMRSLLRDTPERVERIANAPLGVSKRKIGEIVHRALRWWRFPTAEDDLGDLLRSYAWEEGIVDPMEIATAVREAQKLLASIRTSPIFQIVDEAHRAGQRYAELSFVYQTERRTIYGKLDALIQLPNGGWAVVDYKSSTVYGGWNINTLKDHARRYHLQVGVYAAAVQRQFGGLPPAVYIHYIRYNHMLRIETHEWQAALDKIETIIGDAIG